MRKIYSLLLTVLFTAISHAQNIANYVFTPTSGSYTALAGGTNVPSIQADDATSPAIPIGFTFYYMGVPYTTVAANSNGWLSFNASPTANTVDMRTNNFATAVAGLHPLLAPVWDDLDGRTSVIPNPVASYLTTGVPGSRIFTFEWLNWAPFGAVVPNVSFQVKLYEATSVIEFYYRQDGAATYSSASCGISNSPTSFASLSNLGAAPTVSNVTSTNTITALPATGQVYTFTPPSGVIAAPTTLSFTSVGRTSLTVNWVDNSTNETFFTISRATAPGGPYTLAGSVPSTTTAGTGTGYNFNSTGLTPGTTYYYRITASVEGSASPDLSGSQATDPASPFSGAYTINPDAPNSGTNFTTWTEAFAILNSQGLTGPTTFTVTGTGSTITFAEGNLLLGGAYISGVPQSALLTTLNSTNTLSFVAGPGKTINMSGVGVSTTIDYVFRLMGVDYVTFDGINIIDPVTNITNTTQFEFGYVIGNAANSDGANNNTIKNFSATFILTNTGQANGPYGVIVQNGTTLVSALGIAGTYASRNNNNKIQNFTINGAKRGVSFSGLAIPAYDDGNEVSGPAFTSAAGGTWVGGSRVTNGGGATSGTDWGVSIDGQKNMKVFNVQVDNFTETSASPALSGIHFGTAASTATGSEDAQIYNCVIHNLQNNLSLTSGVIGIRASGSTKHTLKIYNNAIYDLRATIATGANVIVGALLTATGTGTKLELYNNSINLPGALAAAGISKGFAFGLATAVITAKNNAINFGTTGGGSTGGVIALDFGATTPTLLDFSSNIYNVGTTSAARRVAVYTSLSRSALIDWQSTMAITNGSSAGVDQRAGYGDPGFVSGTDLTYGAANSVENSGVPISGLATANDILGVARNAATPDLGVFEGNFSAGFVDVAAPGVVIDDFNRGTQAAEIRITVSDNVNTVGNITARLWYRLGVAGAFTALPPDVAPAGTNNGEYRWGTSIRALPVGTYQYYIIVKDAANNYFANPTMAPGAVSPGFASAPDPNWAGVNPFASAGTNTFVVNGAPLAGGTYNVGATETYATLTAVAAELSSRPLSGNVVFELTNNYSGAGETFPIIFNQPSYTVAGPLTITIRPAAGVVTERVTSGDPGASNGLIVLDGMRDLTLDGRPGGVGSSRMWRFTNTRDGVGSLIGPAILMQNDALRNTVKYMTLQSNSNTGLLGVINIGSTFFGGKGNSLNTIDNCDIGPNTAGTLVVPPNPVRGIGAVGGGTNSYNNGNTYSNNNIHDFHNTATNPVGIFVAGETGVTITGNSIYQTAARSGWAAFGLGIAVNGATGPGINISNNFIGGSAPLCAGGPMTISATTVVFYGIQVNTGLYTSASTISNNTFTNMNLTSANTTSGSVIVCGINPATNTNVYPINITNNTIGSTTVDASTSPSIVLTSTSTAASSIFSGVFGSVTGGILNLSNNNIGGVRLVATGTGGTTFIGIQHQTAGVAATIDNNLIGSLATANNIVQNSNAAVSGINNTSTLSLSNALITNNTVANITYNAAVAGTSQTFTGISGAGTAPLTINNNTIRDVVGNNHGSLTGISMTSSGIGTVIRGNTIRSFTINPQVPATAMTVAGISTSSSASTGVIEKNVIHSLVNGSTSTTAALYGTNNQFGANWTYSNNMINLGAGSSGDIIVRGIYDFTSPATTGGVNYYYNTVSISGSAAGGVNNTYAYYNSDGSGVGLKSFRNNIFSNTRTSGTGLGYAVSHSSASITAANISSNYNDLYSATTVAQWQGTGAGNNYTFAGWQTATSGDANSKSALPVFISATDLHLSTAAGDNWCLNGSGIVIPTITTDIDGNIRSVGVAPLGPDMGADEFVATGTVDIATPASQTVCSGTAITTIVLSGAAASYSWTRDNTVAATGIAASGTGNISGTLTNTTTSPVTVTFTITALNGNGCASPGATFTATVSVNPTPDAVATPPSQTICSGATITTIVLSGAVSGTTFNWTRDNTGTVTGIAASGSGDISGALTNTTFAPVTVTFTITPTANGCPGTPITATVLVNPTPDAFATPSSQTICSGSSITTILLSSSTAGATYSWTRDNTGTVTGIAASGAGDISGALANTTNAPVTVTFTITPTANGCPGTPITATVLVNPTPDAVATPSSQTICSGLTITTIALSGAVSGTTFNWVRDNVATVTGIAASGSGNISGALTNTTASPVTVTFTITPTANGCSGTPITATVTVDPCNITDIDFINQGSCNDNGTPNNLTDDYYTADVVVTYLCPPLTGDLRLEQSGAVIDNTNTIPVGSLVGGSHTFTAVRLRANGLANPAKAEFTAASCIRIENAPVVAVCSIPTCPQLIVAGTSPFQDSAWTIDVSNGNVITRFGPTLAGFTITGINSITRHPGPAGDVYAILKLSGVSGRVLAKMDLTTGVCTQIGNLGDNFSTITFKYNAIDTVLYGVTGDGATVPETMYSIDHTTGVKTLFRALGNGADGEVIVYNPDDAKFYHWSGNGTVVWERFGTGAADPIEPLTYTGYGGGEIFGAVYIGNGKFIVSTISSNMRVWDVAGNVGPVLFGTPDDLRGLVITRNGPLCDITDITFSNQSSCNNNGTVGDLTDDFYTADVTVVFNNKPCTGDLRLIQRGAVIDNIPLVPVGSITGNSYTFTTIRLRANGLANLVETDFTAIPDCYYAETAPVVNECSSCTVTCPANITVSNDPNQCGAVVNFTITTSGSCGIVTATPASGSFFPVGTTTVNVTSGAGPSCSFTVTVNDTQPPTITCPSDIVLCGSQVVNFATPIASDNCPGVVVTQTGGPSSGSVFPVGTTVVTFTATDAASNTATCSFNVIINPIPDAVATPSSQTICSGATITTIVLTGAVSGTTFNWTRDNTVAVTGIAASGSGDISGALTNTTNAPVTVTFTITPTANGCPGTPITATVLVNPTPNAVATPASQTICSGATITTIVLSGAVSGTTFNWTRDNTVAVTGIAASGSGNISGALTNTTAAPVTVTFTITPTANGCPGAPITATVLVNPTPNAVATPSSQIICSATPITTIVLSGTVSGTTFAWTRDNLVNLTGIAASGSGNISGTLTNTTNVVQTTTFTIIPTANGCPGAPITATVTVNPTPTVSPVPPNQIVCNGFPTAPVNFSGPVAGTAFNWVNNTPSIGLAASGTGNIAAFIATNPGTVPVVATVTVTPSSGGSLCTPSAPQTFTNSTPVAIPTGPAVVTSTINVSGAPIYLYDLNVITNLTHTFSADLDITIMSPAGTVVTLTTDNGAGNDNVFNGTLWDDDANPAGQVPYTTNNGVTTDHAYVNLTLASPLTPEEALGAFIGENPNGTWTITISDDLGGDGGSLNSWSLVVSGLTTAPTLASSAFTQSTPVAIPTGPAVVTSTLVVSGAGTLLHDVNLTTFLTHTFAADLDITLRSPAGTIVTLTTDNGAGNDNVFNGTVWDDDANPAGQVPYTTNNGLVTDHTYVNLTLASPLVPEENLAAFVGEDPNGTWTITISDDLGGDGGSLNSWTLNLQTATCASGISCTGTPVTFTYTVNPTPNAVATPNTQTICSGAAMTPIVLSGNVSGTTFNWVRNNTVNVTGIANSGSGNISGTPVNITTVQQTVTYTITPVANGCTGPSITATLIVNVGPTITCPANITVNNAPGFCGANVTYPPATATGSPAPVITYSQASGTFFPVGTTTVTATATNACGVATCTFTITVLDVQAPTITCPAPITVNTDVGVCTATIPVPNPTTADNCAVTQLTWVMTGATVASSPATGINNIGTFTFNLNGTTGTGVTTVTYTVKDAAGNTTTCSFTVTVNDIWIPVISGQPANQTVCVGTNAVFTVTASVPAGNPLTYRWQTWNGSAWVDISPAQTAATLTLNAVTFSMNTNSYRCILTGRCSVVTSGFATLYVNQLPTISLLASGPLALLPAQSVTLTAVVNPGGGSYQWFKNGVAIAGATGASLNNLTVDDIGSYTCRYTDLNGCVATSAAMVVSGQTSDNLYVYPNPNDGHFHVRFYNLINEEVTVSVYDAIGQLIYRRKVITSPTPYTDIEVDLGGRNAAGTYVVVLNNASGRQVGAKKIIVYDR